VESNVYDVYLGKYIDSVLKIKEFEIIDEEYGVIPMTDFPFEKYNSKAVTKIGTGGGWVKGSTGYSFKNSDNKISILIDNLKNNNLPSKGFFKKRYQFYDKVFLHVLKNNNKKGEWIFDKFYSRNSITNMFSFLNEETSFLRELKIMSSLLSITFLKSFFKSL
jgi:lycopene beta-cyclase